VCKYPNGKLKNGMQYESLVSSGFTSPVIAGMVLDRNMDGALEIAGNLRQRHDGRHRSPWNEPECGLLYSRAMAHWNIYDQAVGHVYCSQTGALSFDPRSDVAVSGGARMFKVCGGPTAAESSHRPPSHHITSHHITSHHITYALYWYGFLGSGCG
jgi:hypothetical protein